MSSTCPTLTASLLILAATAGGCAKPQIIPRSAPGVQIASITVTSPSFTDGSRIPVDHTCDGKELIPELVFSAPPGGTQSLVLIVEDPDAPSGTFTHMIAFNLAPDLHKLASGTELDGAGESARFGLNDFQVAHYSGPCPPRGEGHRYRFRVVALDTVLKLPDGAPHNRIEEAMDGHILGEGMLTGHFAH